MRIKMLSNDAGPNGIFPSGSVRDVSDEEGRQLISGGYAVEIFSIGLNKTFGNKWWALRELGEGGQGKVYLAEDKIHYQPLVQQFSEGLPQQGDLRRVPFSYEKTRTLLELIRQVNSQFDDHRAAVKELHANRDSEEYKKALKRMKQELQALRDVHHSNIVKLYDESIEKGWFAMEYFPRGPLSQCLQQFKGNINSTLRSFRELVEAVSVLHEKGMVHRDIKPDNIYMRDNALILGDFGLIWSNKIDKSRISDTYENVGSRDWMPAWAYRMRPEEVKPAFDVFGLGKVLWAMLSAKTVLNLWYFKRDEYNLERLFPENDGMKLVNELLSKCIVEEEKDCLKSASELLTELDKTIHRFGIGGAKLAKNDNRKCPVCGIGTYKMIVNANSTDAHNFGLQPTGMSGFKIYTCDSCGHVQLFHFENVEAISDSPVWGSDPKR